jgi:hypothetical protein
MQADKILSEIARDDLQLPGAVGDAMRARMADQASADLIQDVLLAHARARESIVTGARMALRCGALLLKTGGDWAPLLRATGISEETAADYVALALTYPDMARTVLQRLGRVTEAQALGMLQGEPAASPVDDLRALRGLQS